MWCISSKPQRLTPRGVVVASMSGRRISKAKHDYLGRRHT